MKVMTTTKHICVKCKSTTIKVYNPHPLSEGPNEPDIPKDVPCGATGCMGVAKLDTVTREFI